MNWRRLTVLVLIAGSGWVIVILPSVDRELYDSLTAEINAVVSGFPEPVVLGAMYLGIIAVWIATMILLGKILYTLWKQIDKMLLKLLDRFIPDSPLIRFALGVGIMLFIVGILPLAYLQTNELTGAEEQVNQTLDKNDTDGELNETGTATPTQTQATFTDTTAATITAKNRVVPD